MFQQTDPLDTFTPSTSANTYQYANGEPLRFVDPAGLCYNDPKSAYACPSPAPFPGADGAGLTFFTAETVYQCMVRVNQNPATSGVYSSANQCGYTIGSAQGLSSSTFAPLSVPKPIQQAVHSYAQFWAKYGKQISLAAGVIQFAICVIPVTSEACWAVGQGVAIMTVSGRTAVFLDSGDRSFNAFKSQVINDSTDVLFSRLYPAVEAAAAGEKQGLELFKDSAANRWLVEKGSSMSESRLARVGASLALHAAAAGAEAAKVAGFAIRGVANVAGQTLGLWRSVGCLFARENNPWCK